MANWLEIANTVINLETLLQVSGLSTAQNQIAGQLLAGEWRKGRDNAILSKLVDVVLKVRQLLQDNQYLDAVLSSGVGLLVFDELYSEIIDADTKLKASDIQVKLSKTIRTTVLDSAKSRVLQSSLTNFFSNIQISLKQIVEQLKTNQYSLVLLDPEFEWEINIGEDFLPIQNLIDPTSKVGIFTKGKVYRVIYVNPDDKSGFFLVDDLGQKRLVAFNETGGAQYFMFFEPPIPSLENEITGWELCCKIFANENQITNLKSLHSNMFDIFNNAIEEANVSKSEIVKNIIKYKELRQEIIDRSFKSMNKKWIKKP